MCYEKIREKYSLALYSSARENIHGVKVFPATYESPLTNDFVQTCESYWKQLDINMKFEELGKLSTLSGKNLVKVKTNFRYLINPKLN